MGNNVSPATSPFSMMMPATTISLDGPTKDLNAMLANPKIKGALREKILDEVQKRLEENLSSDKGTKDDARQLELLQKLRAGSITDRENDELGKLMGVVLPRPEPKSGEQNVV